MFINFFKDNRFWLDKNYNTFFQILKMELVDSELYSNNNKQEIINKVLENKKTLCEIGKNIFRKLLRINTNERKYFNMIFQMIFQKLSFLYLINLTYN